MPPKNDDANLAKLNKLLAKHIAKKEAYFNKIQRLYDLSADLTNPINLTEFKIEMNTLDENMALFKQCIDEINDVNLDINHDYVINYKPLEMIDSLYCRIKEAAKSIPSTQGVVGNQTNLAAVARLQKIEIPEFSGDPKKVANDTSKIHYLLGALKGKALDVCAGILPTAANYPILWKTLIDKYQDKRLLANTYFTQMLEFKPVQQESAICLNSFLEKIQHSTSLALSKLDGQTHKLFEMSSHSEIPTYEEIVNFVKNQSKALGNLSKNNNMNSGKPNASSSIPKGKPTQSFVCHLRHHSLLHFDNTNSASSSAAHSSSSHAHGSINPAVVLENIPENIRLSEKIEFNDSSEINCPLKVLGLQWNPTSDVFSFAVNIPDKICTKRNILSTLARIWDPLGFLSALTLYAKLLIKELWLSKISWDSEPPTNIKKLWSEFQEELSLLSQFQVPRHVGAFEHAHARLIGFADSSSKGYGAIVYIKIITASNDIKINLMCAKSKVAPVKVCTIARLELCAALLLAKLIKSVLDSCSARIQIEKISALSDSTVVLHWINNSPHKWKVFVANRVAKIQSIVPSTNWFHIDSENNIADCLSRGLTPSRLVHHATWVSGPPWLILEENKWPTRHIAENRSFPLQEEKLVAMPALVEEDNPLRNLILRISSWSKLRRITVYILRFAKILPVRKIVSATDLEKAELTLISIEALLNSRPLCWLSNDPTDPLPLTPAHFLTLTPLKSLPANDLSNQNVNLLSRKELLDQLVQSFWNRWRVEYLNSLQIRQKWNTPSCPVTKGTLVLIMQDNIPPLQWPLGLIEETFPGKDGVNRVALVRCKNTAYKRPIVKLCPLPQQ
ncbi:hypothetical protein NQ317_008542 [Molorchus minor]|uniref:DUF5641 domain-containing protein n=1 Tax=Molorchus minor TaxID=1323400 RepID=A0ABQ9J2R0_9CUCU|nr:hypothetical protein NQ317_008542 [Molorchus minor]